MRIMFPEEGYGVEDKQLLLEVQALSEEHAAELALQAAGNYTFNESCDDFLQNEDEPQELPALATLNLNSDDAELSFYQVVLIRRGWLNANGTNNDADYAVLEVSGQAPSHLLRAGVVMARPDEVAARRANTLERKQNEQVGMAPTQTLPRARM